MQNGSKLPLKYGFGSSCNTDGCTKGFDFGWEPTIRPADNFKRWASRPNLALT